MKALLLTLIPLLSSGCLVPGTERVGGVADRSLAMPGSQRAANPNSPFACRLRRERFAQALGQGLVVLCAGPDPEGRFEADPDFYWLTGLNEPDAALLLLVEGGELLEQRLYLQAATSTQALWNGERLAPGAAAREVSGIASVRPLEELRDDLGVLLADQAHVFAEGAAARAHFESFERVPDSPRATLSRLQATKDQAELQAVQAAIDITIASLADAFVVAVPGAYEYQAEAAIEGGFRRRGAEFRAFPSICGSGPNGCVLHYRANQRRLQAGDLLLMDVGAQYAGYCADITRTIPVDGKFTPRQRELYELVLATQELCAALLRPGITMAELNQAAKRNFADAGYGGAFRHGIGHHLGIRTHDAPGFKGALEPGMVITIEPGLYLPGEGLGIRIEDDYLLTEDGALKLSAALPSDPDRLEAYIARLRR